MRIYFCPEAFSNTPVEIDRVSRVEMEINIFLNVTVRHVLHIIFDFLSTCYGPAVAICCCRSFHEPWFSFLFSPFLSYNRHWNGDNIVQLVVVRMFSRREFAWTIRKFGSKRRSPVIGAHRPRALYERERRIYYVSHTINLLRKLSSLVSCRLPSVPVHRRVSVRG